MASVTNPKSHARSGTEGTECRSPSIDLLPAIVTHSASPRNFLIRVIRLKLQFVRDAVLVLVGFFVCCCCLFVFFVCVCVCCVCVCV